MQINISLFCVQLLLFFMLEKELGNILSHKCHLKKQAELIPSFQHQIFCSCAINLRGGLSANARSSKNNDVSDTETQKLIRV